MHLARSLHLIREALLYAVISAFIHTEETWVSYSVSPHRRGALMKKTKAQFADELATRRRQIAELKAPLAIERARYEINAIPLKKDEKATKILGIARDITKRKQTEEILQKVHKELARRGQEHTAKLSKANVNLKKEIAERRLTQENIRRAKREWEATFDAVSDLISIIDLKGTIRRCNRAVKQTFKTSYQDLIGRPVNEVFYGTVNPATRVFQSLLSEQSPTRKRTEAQFPRLAGWFEVTRHPITSPKRGAFQGTVYTLTDISERKRTEKQLQASYKQLRALSTHLQSVREEERKCVAREIHDELGQVLTSLKLDLSRLANQLPEISNGTSSLSQGQIAAMSKHVDTALLSVRRISTSLRPEVLDHFGLAAAMEWQAQEFQNRTRTRCEFTALSESIDLDQERRTVMFRILQETLTNVARHAQATKVSIGLQETAGNLVLRVTDNGRGITESEISDVSSLGLLGMQERAFLLGGEFHIKGVQGKGTTVVVQIPIDRSGCN